MPPSPATFVFLAQTLRLTLTKGLHLTNKRALLTLAEYSRQCFLQLESELELSFDGDHAGLIDLASDMAAWRDLETNAGLLTEANIPHRLLSPDEVRRIEPGISPDSPLVGALQVINDGTGDCHRFTQALAEECEAMGVQFLYGHTVVGIQQEGKRIRGLTLAPVGEAARPQLQADTFVLCAGCDSKELGEQLGERLPIYPVKGYSLTARLTNPERAPRSTVVDDQFKVVSTRLGDRLRVTGFVELTDRQRNIPEQRLATLRRAVGLRFPGAADLDTAESWTGFRPMTPDGPPIIGPGKASNLFLNTGHGTFGWTLSAASAELTAQALAGEPLALSLEPFRAQRFR